MSEGKQVPLIEMLQSVPIGARLAIDDGPYSTTYYNVGALCHRAAAALKSVNYTEKNEELQAAIFFMRDDHSFRRLSEDVSTALAEIEQEFNQGWTYGSLCSKREGFTMIHASGSKNRLEFFAACKQALENAYGKKTANVSYGRDTEDTPGIQY